MNIIQEIGTSIIMFLIGSACTFFLGKWSNVFKKIDSLEYGVQALLRNRMIQTTNYYREKKKAVPQWELESFEQMYEAYKKLGGNGYVEDVRHEIVEELKHETH